MSKKKKAVPPPPSTPVGCADDSGCRGCGFHNTGYTAGTCDFCYITGERRGCPVEGCTRYTAQKQARSRELILDGSNPPQERPRHRMEKPWEQPRRGHPTFSRAAAWALYQAGAGDAEIAAELRCSRTPVRLWRKRHGLPVNVKGRKTDGDQ